MKAKKWIGIWVIIVIILLSSVGGFNYLIDPYGLYNTKYFNFNKIRKERKTRLVKALKIKEIKPISISLGTSRTDGGYDHNHQYFTKPSYNLGVGAASMYESKLYFQNTLKQGSLKKVLLVADYIMFNALAQKRINEFESYFTNHNAYKYLISFDTLKDTLWTTLKGVKELYFYGIQSSHTSFANGPLKRMTISLRAEYKKYNKNYAYKDTNKKSFPDFEEVVRLSYENNIELDIIFGPSHIKQWEALNYYIGYDKWLQWKKDIVLSVNKIANQQNKKQFRIMDFAVYHKLTAQKVPSDKKATMKYYADSSHYKSTLGVIVLNRLIENSKYKDLKENSINQSRFSNFGVELNLQNIDKHLKQQKIDRHKFIDVRKHQIEVFGNTNNL